MIVARSSIDVAIHRQSPRVSHRDLPAHSIVREQRMASDLKGKVVLITGASTGIGAAAARAFARLGSRVLIHYNASKDAAESVAAGGQGARRGSASGRRRRDRRPRTSSASWPSRSPRAAGSMS